MSSQRSIDSDAVAAIARFAGHAMSPPRVEGQVGHLRMVLEQTRQWEGVPLGLTFADGHFSYVPFSGPVASDADER